jgi:hypothetical protein
VAQPDVIVAGDHLLGGAVFGAAKLQPIGRTVPHTAMHPCVKLRLR